MKSKFDKLLREGLLWNSWDEALDGIAVVLSAHLSALFIPVTGSKLGLGDADGSYPLGGMDIVCGLECLIDTCDACPPETRLSDQAESEGGNEGPKSCAFPSDIKKGSQSCTFSSEIREALASTFGSAG